MLMHMLYIYIYIYIHTHTHITLHLYIYSMCIIEHYVCINVCTGNCCTHCVYGLATGLVNTGTGDFLCAHCSVPCIFSLPGLYRL
jgi:hypothetical protein